MDILLDAFSYFNLPRTPFSISMFLWILERENSYKAQNNSILIECFIEDLLKSKDRQKLGSRTVFDYKNKFTLLAEIAYKMLHCDNENYNMSYTDLLIFITKYLSDLSFIKIYSPKVILEDLLDTGLLISDGNEVRFRFTCFFEFMLAKRMEYEPNFKKEVLDDNNYLKYASEIIYYTGLHRGEQDILKMIIEDLEYRYIDINDIVFQKVASVDNFFNVDRSLVEQITAKDLFEVLPEKQTEEENNQETDKKYAIQSKRNNQNIIKKKDHDKFSAYFKVLILAMNVLKNSEEIKTKSMKYDSYVTILKNSISYFILFKLICESIVYHKDKFPEERVEELLFSLRIIPDLHLEMLCSHLGTYKLSEIFKAKIDDDYKNLGSISELERFLSVFLYADVRGTDFKDEMNKFIKSFNMKYIADACYLKFLVYYYKSKEDKFDQYLLKNLSELYSRLHISNDKQNKMDKSKILNELMVKKKMIKED